MSAIDQYLDLYAAQQELVCQGSCAAMNALRPSAFAFLRQNGLPTRKAERYRYTDVEEALAPDFGLNLQRLPLTKDPYAAYRCNVQQLEAWNYYVVNDTVAPPRTSSDDLPGGVFVGSICEYAQKNSDFIEKYYHRLAGRGRDALTELNTLLVQDGIVVRLPRGTKLPKALQIVSIAAATLDFMSNRRLLVVAEAGAEATLLLCDHATEGRRSLTTQVIEVFADETAKIDLYSIEETHYGHARFCHTYVEQKAGSRVCLNGMTLRNGLTHNQTDVRLVGEGATVQVHGAVIADRTEHVDNNILVAHVAGGCESDVLYKYVLDDESVGAFAGKVLVEKGAQKTLSQETNANLCASPKARAYAQPMLEIYADDVKCNHGSTVGKLDETALFYMRQRGIPEAEARLLLKHAFVNDVLRRITLEPLRDRLSYLVDKRFRRELRACEGCHMSSICQ